MAAKHVGLRRIALWLGAPLLLACDRLAGGVEAAPLEVQLVVSAPATSTAAPATITTTIRNIGSRRVELWLTCGSPHLEIERLDGPLAASRGTACSLPFVPPTPLDPGQTIQRRTSWAATVAELYLSGSAPFPPPPPPGRYRLRSRVVTTTGAHAISEPTDMEVLP
jgi:hypothetical protein